jgi:DNA invertase Pin-like site-specific DNA recombinase
VDRLIAIPYLRVSTDDKGQNPRRQLEVIEPWAEREGVELLEPVIDEGSSASKLSPFERPRFVKACELARNHRAMAIIVECADRFSRQGQKKDGWAEEELGRRFGLRLLRADKPLEQHGTLAGDLGDAFKAEFAREWVREHARKVKSGIARAKREGRHVGRPRKQLELEEIVLIRKMHAAGVGLRRIALKVSELRGAFGLADPSHRRRRSISHQHVKRILDAAVTKPSRSADRQVRRNKRTV